MGTGKQPKRRRRSKQRSIGRWCRRLSLLSLLALVLYLGWVTLWVRSRFEGQRWPIPSIIYASPRVLVPDHFLEVTDLKAHLEILGLRVGDQQPPSPGHYRIDGEGVTLTLPAVEGARTTPHPIRLEVTDDRLHRLQDLRTGAQLSRLELPPREIDRHYGRLREHRLPVDLDEISPDFLDALVANEDRRFWHHSGIDLRALGRALLADLKAGALVQGGSTLTQQLVKNFFLHPEKRLSRKLQEALMALVLEILYDKEEILVTYCNEIYFGQGAGIAVHGVEAAARHYFGCSAAELTTGQAATLVAMIPAPNAYDPLQHPRQAEQRRRRVLERWQEVGGLSPEQKRQAEAEPLIPPRRSAVRAVAPYFTDAVFRELGDQFPPALLSSAGLRVHTTLDEHIQAAAQGAVAKGLDELIARRPRLAEGEERPQAALIAVEPATGRVRGLVGGNDARSSPFNRVLDGHRQPGSLFKLIVYLAAFAASEAGEIGPLSPVSYLQDAPFHLPAQGSRPAWEPRNFDHRFRGPVTVREAFEQSINLPAVHLAQEVGLASVVETGRRLGITSPLQELPSTALGSQEVTPWEMATALSTLVNLGSRPQLATVDRVEDSSGHPLTRYPPGPRDVVSANACALVLSLMEGVTRTGTAKRAAALPLQRFGGKTGTTNDYRDAWFAGFTPELVTVVWVGFDRPRSLEATGASAALPIWLHFMEALETHLGHGDLPDPPGIRRLWVDPVSGLLATRRCPIAHQEPFLIDQAPTEPCPLHPARLLGQEGRREDLPSRLHRWWQRLRGH